MRHSVRVILKQVENLKLQKYILWNMQNEISYLQENNNSR